MTRLLLLLLMTSVLGCHQNIIAEAQDVQENSLDYFLAFDITNIDYSNPDAQETTSVYSNQNLETRLQFQDLTTIDRYLFFATYLNISEDSIALIGQLQFILDESTPFEQEVFDLEFVHIEARSNLTPQPDGTYTYNNLGILAERLRQDNWGQSVFSGNSQLNQFLLSFPNPNLGEHHMENYTLTSNGFYFEHENLSFTDITFRESANQIDLSGNFNVEMKELSCGFFSYFSVENARFQALIQ